MVKVISRLFAIVSFVLPLAACFFALSAFPATLPQVVARVDLSATIASGYGSQYQPYVVTPAGGEFVLLVNPSGSVDPALMVFDSNLKLIQTNTQSQLSGWGITSGWFVMPDAAGNVAMRDHWFSASDLQTVNHGPSAALGTNLWGPGFSSPNGLKNDINFQIAGGNTLSYSYCNSCWCGLTGSTPVTISSSGGSYSVQAVYNVSDIPTAGEVVLVLNQSGGSRSYFISIPLVDVLNDAIASPILSNYLYKTVQNVDTSSIGFAGDCLVAYDSNSNSMVRYSTSTFDVISSISMNTSNNHGGKTKYAYKMTGGYSVVFDSDARTLTKVADWW